MIDAHPPQFRQASHTPSDGRRLSLEGGYPSNRFGLRVLVFTGNFAAANEASTKAAKFSKIAFGVAIGLFVLYVVFYAIIIAAIISHAHASQFAG
jgi:hypothetical protein